MPRAAEPLSLNNAAARHIWLRAQRLDTKAPFGEGASAVAAAVDPTAGQGSLGGTRAVVDDLDAGLAVVDAYAAEHLEIQTRDPEALVGRIRNAGAVFVGPHAPVPLGDYSAGSNHVLPTSGTARHSSGLNTVTFLRLQQRIRYTETGLKEVADGIGVLAEDERLPAHGAAIRARFA